MGHSAHTFCQSLAERGFFLERLLVLPSSAERMPTPLIQTKEASADVLKFAALLEKAERGSAVDGRYIVYLMTVQRRGTDSAGLAVASVLSRMTGKPLLVIEAMSGNAPWSSERVHSFIGQGAAHNSAHIPGYLFVPQGRDPKISPEECVSARIDTSLAPEIAYATGLISATSDVANAQIIPNLLKDAAAVVCDWASFYIFPDIALRSKKLVEKVSPQAPFLLTDDVGLVPVFKYLKAEAAARFIRPKLKTYIETAERERLAIASMIKERIVFQEQLHLKGELLLGDVVGTSLISQRDYGEAITEFSGVSRSVAAVKNTLGGEAVAQERLQDFIGSDLSRYGDERNHPDLSCSSRLSPWLHFGMIHPRTILAEVSRANSVVQAAQLPVESSAAKFVDELVTWRELGQNMAHYAYQNSLALGNPALVPSWAWETLKKFTPPEAKQVSLEHLEAAESPDPVWNAAQKELVRTGVVHNYMRMIWGKGIVRWSNGPQQALARLEYLNNKYSLDGRDPNSYTGILWCLGKFDRPWPPAREPFGLVRSMTTASARKKLKMENYLKTWSELSVPQLLLSNS
jgi:deoxyribodipyrimidine photo-lyase